MLEINSFNSQFKDVIAYFEDKKKLQFIPASHGGLSINGVKREIKKLRAQEKGALHLKIAYFVENNKTQFDENTWYRFDKSLVTALTRAENRQKRLTTGFLGKLVRIFCRSLIRKTLRVVTELKALQKITNIAKNLSPVKSPAPKKPALKVLSKSSGAIALPQPDFKKTPLEKEAGSTPPPPPPPPAKKTEASAGAPPPPPPPGGKKLGATAPLLVKPFLFNGEPEALSFELSAKKLTAQEHGEQLKCEIAALKVYTVAMEKALAPVTAAIKVVTEETEILNGLEKELAAITKSIAIKEAMIKKLADAKDVVYLYQSNAKKQISKRVPIYPDSMHAELVTKHKVKITKKLTVSAAIENLENSIESNKKGLLNLQHQIEQKKAQIQSQKDSLKCEKKFEDLPALLGKKSNLLRIAATALKNREEILNGKQAAPALPTAPAAPTDELFPGHLDISDQDLIIRLRLDSYDLGSFLTPEPEFDLQLSTTSTMTSSKIQSTLE